MSSGYRLAPHMAARLVGLLLVAVAGLVVLLTVVSAVMQWSPWVIVGSGVVSVVAAVVVAAILLRVELVSLDGDGYRVRMVRGAGVTSGRWADVTEAVAANPRGIDCLVIRLRDGGTTTIPVAALAADPAAFVTDVRAHLRRGEGPTSP
ncbi:MAG: hypothetical protein ACRDO4_09805 [Nocardioides sp.]